MGLSLEFVLADDAHVEEFICKVCLQLMESPLCTSLCGHAFCKPCLESWFRAQEQQGMAPNCPTCKANLATDKIVELRKAEPLAWRVMGKIKVRCPLEGCGWKGDYYSLEAHMTSTKLHPKLHATGSSSEGDASGLQLAESLKEQGNSKFESGKYKEAIALYTKAINIAPVVPTYYYNRAGAWFMLRAFAQCIADCHETLKLDALYAKAYVRLGKALCEQGAFDQAVQVLDKAEATLSLANANADEVCAIKLNALEMNDTLRAAKAAIDDNQPDEALQALAFVSQRCSASVITCLMAEAELLRGRVDRVIASTISLLRADPSSVEALTLRGKALYLSGDFDQALAHLKQALTLDPDGTAKTVFLSLRKVSRAVMRGRELHNTRNFVEAEEQFSGAIVELKKLLGPNHSMCYPLVADVFAERATCYIRLERYEEALKDAAISLRVQEDNRQGLIARTTALTKLGRPREAMQSMVSCLNSFGQHDAALRGAYERAEFEARRVDRPNYYKILDVPEIAPIADIRHAYKQQALLCHPDKFSNAPEDDQQKAEAQFKILQDALEVLTGEMTRKLYDEGFDKEAIMERMERANRAARENRSHGHY